MTDSVVFTVLGIPAPQGNKTAYAIAGKDGAKPRAVMAEGKSETGRRAVAAWRDAVARAANETGRYFDEPVFVQIHFFFPLPATDQYRTRHVARPDVEKLARSTLDSLTAGGLIRDDSLVCELCVSKRYARGRAPGATISVVPLGEHEARDRERLKTEAREARRAA